MKVSTTKTIPTFSYSEQGLQDRPDTLVVEEPLEIRLAFGRGNARKRISLAVTMRTPGDDEALAAGFLFTEGIIARSETISGFRRLEENTLLVELEPNAMFDEERLVRHFFASSSCGICGKASIDAVETVSSYFPVLGKPNISPDLILDLPEQMRKVQSTFDRTGGLHAAALFSARGELLQLNEDIGRHNATDKVIGRSLLEATPPPFRDHIMLISGRAGFELVQKASMAGIPILAAVGAPSSLSVDLAKSAGLTLIGFLRDGRFNIYSGSERFV